eukprot:2197416-Prymnesium_polylepis.2
MQAALTAAEAGVATVQCTSTLCVFLLYVGRLGADDEVEQYERELAALGGNPRGTVDVTRFTSYIKSSCVILERALKSVRL